MPERLLLNPGLVENGPDGVSCYLACLQMLMRTRHGARVYSFAEMDEIQGRKPGYYSWEYALLDRLSREGFECGMIGAFSLTRFVDEGAAYLTAFFGEGAARDMLDHTEDLRTVIEAVRRFMASPAVRYEERVPSLDDIRRLIDEDYYLIPTINQRLLQADPGFAMHSVFVYGYSARGVRFHNPGPPSTEGSEITWEMFDKAWSSPSESARQLIYARAQK